MKTSARNEFSGVIDSIKIGTVNAEVVLDIGHGHQLVAIVTNESVAELSLVRGLAAYALIKAPWVIVTPENSPLKTSARNRLCGVVSHCQTGPINGEIVLTLTGGQQLAAIITQESVEGLGLQVGMRACALIKASHIVLAVAV
jgi:molybdate transport system regulatory protein